jgi:hypothetical protein
MELENINKYFPIQSQTSEQDRVFIFDVLNLMKRSVGQFHYIEIGSFMGGSLAPFLIEDNCLSILSIDERERQQPDERGALYDYGSITSEKMIDNLHEHGLSTSKLRVFDGSIDSVPPQNIKFDLGFIDAEHTDEAAFRDYLYIMDFMNEDCLIMFHDSSLVSKALRHILIMLRKQGAPFHSIKRFLHPQERNKFYFFKRAGSEMSCITFGKFAKIELNGSLGESEDENEF